MTTKSFPTPRLIFGSRICGSDFFLEGSCLGQFSTPITIHKMLLEFPFWCELMWQLQYMHVTVSWLEPKFLGFSLLVRPCSAYYMKYQEQRNKSRGLLSNFVVSKNRRICFLEFQYLWVYPSHSKPSWLNSWYKIPAWQLYPSFHTLPVGQVRLYICLEISTFIQHSKKFPWLEISTFNMHAHPGCLRGWHVFFNFLNNSMASRHLKTLMFLKSRGILSVDTFPKLWLLRRQNFLRVFFPFLSFRFCLRGWPWAAAPEAKHRCTLQPRTATIGSSSGSSRPRRSWMRRTTKMAVASEEDLGANLLRHEIVVRKWVECWWFKFLMRILISFPMESVSPNIWHWLAFCVVLCNDD